MLLEVTVGSNGRVNSVEILENDLNASVGNCVRSKMRSIRFRSRTAETKPFSPTLRLQQGLTPSYEEAAMERLELPAIRSLVQTEQFGSWFAEFTDSKLDLECSKKSLTNSNLKRRRMLFECDYWHDRADESLLESSRLRAEIENLEADAARAEAEAYRVLMRYENKRAEVTELWEKIGVVELRVDDYRDEATRNRIQKKIQPELNRLRDAYGTVARPKNSFGTSTKSWGSEVQKRL